MMNAGITTTLAAVLDKRMAYFIAGLDTESELGFSWYFTLPIVSAKLNHIKNTHINATIDMMINFGTESANFVHSFSLFVITYMTNT